MADMVDKIRGMTTAPKFKAKPGRGKQAKIGLCVPQKAASSAALSADWTGGQQAYEYQRTHGGGTID
jgi:hypothetical protein